MRIETAVLRPNGVDTGYVQYGRSTEHVDATIDRIWLLIVAGILGGTLLAGLAGVAIASRAMRPIAALTASAREISETRDPSAPHARARRSKTRSANWPRRWRRCCARSTPRAPSASRRCSSSASSSPTPRTSCARR